MKFVASAIGYLVLFYLVLFVLDKLIFSPAYDIAKTGRKLGRWNRTMSAAWGWNKLLGHLVLILVYLGVIFEAIDLAVYILSH